MLALTLILSFNLVLKSLYSYIAYIGPLYSLRVHYAKLHDDRLEFLLNVGWSKGLVWAGDRRG